MTVDPRAEFQQRFLRSGVWKMNLQTSRLPECHQHASGIYQAVWVHNPTLLISHRLCYYLKLGRQRKKNYSHDCISFVPLQRSLEKRRDEKRDLCLSQNIDLFTAGGTCKCNFWKILVNTQSTDLCVKVWRGFTSIIIWNTDAIYLRFIKNISICI